MNLLKKGQMILEGHKNYYFQKPHIEKLVKMRLPACTACPNLYFNKQNKQRCKLCPCPMDAKMRSPTATCPFKNEKGERANKWEPQTSKWKEEHYEPGTNKLKKEFQ